MFPRLKTKNNNKIKCLEGAEKLAPSLFINSHSNYKKKKI